MAYSRVITCDYRCNDDGTDDTDYDTDGGDNDDDDGDDDGDEWDQGGHDGTTIFIGVVVVARAACCQGHC